MSDAKGPDLGERDLPGKIPVIAPDGTHGTLPASMLHLARSGGYTIPTGVGAIEATRDREKKRFYTSPEAKLTTALTAAASGATLGASDIALKALGGDSEVYGELKAYNPNTATAANIAGGILPGLLGGGAVAGRLGAVLGKETAKTLGRKIAVNAATGTALGAGSGALHSSGQVVSELAMGDADMSAQKIASHVGMGFLLGGATGGLLGGASPLVAAGARASRDAAKEVLQKSLQALGRGADDASGAAKRLAVRSLRARPNMYDKLENRGLYNDVGDELLKPNKVLGGKTIMHHGGDLAETSTRAKTVLVHAGREKGEKLKVLSKMAKRSDSKIEVKNVIEDLKKMRKDVVDIPGRGGDRSFLERTISEFEDLSKSKKISLTKMDNMKQKLQDVAKKEYDKVQGVRTFRGDVAVRQAAAVNKEIDRVAKAAAQTMKRPDVYDDFVRSKRTFRLVSEIDDLAESGLKRGGSNKMFSITDLATGGSGGTTGAIVGTMLAGPAGGLVGGIGGKVLAQGTAKIARERGAAVVSGLLNRSRSMGRLSASVGRADSRIASAVDRLARGTRRAAEGGKRAVGAAAAGTRRVAAASVKGTRSTAEGLAISTGDVQTPDGSIPSLRRLVGPSTGEVLDRISFAPSSGAQKAADADTPDGSFRKRVGELAELMRDPNKVQERLAAAVEGMDDLAPATAMALAQSMVTAVSYLHKTAPKPPSYPGMAMPFMSDKSWGPSQRELTSWARKVAAVNDPVSVAEDIIEGTATPEAVDALKAVYPKLHQDIVMKMMDRYDEIRSSADYGARVSLSIFLGVPFDETMRPEIIRTIQSEIGSQTGEDEAQSEQTLRPTVSGTKQLESADRAQTQLDRLAAR